MAQILLQPVNSGWKKAGPAQIERVHSWILRSPKAMAMALCQELAEFFWLFIRTAARGDWTSQQWSAGAQRALTWLILQRGPHLEVDGVARRCWTMFAHWVVSVWTVPSGEDQEQVSSSWCYHIKKLKCWENWNLYSEFWLLILKLQLPYYRHHFE